MLGAATAAAATGALGALPLLGRAHLPARTLGWANALAAGAMLGAAHMLMVRGLSHGALWASAGAVAAFGAVSLTHLAAGLREPRLAGGGRSRPAAGGRALLLHALHSAPEGIAIGVAMVVHVPFGLFMAAAIALHNIPESTVLCVQLRSGGVPLARAAGLAVLAKGSQVLLAVLAFAAIGAVPAMLPAVLGFAVGALVYLVLAELLPESYRQAGHTGIALVTILAMGVVVLLGGWRLP